MGLPTATTAQDWTHLLKDDAALRAGVASIVQRHLLGTATTTRYDSGSLPVYAVGAQHVLKLYPPHEAAHAAVEARVLTQIDGALPLRIPEVIATGMLDGWHYLLMSQLHGHRLVDAWPELQLLDRERLAEQLGSGVAALHALDAAPLADLPPPHWAEFITAQRSSAVERQRARGLAPPWLEQIDDFLDRWAPPLGTRRVLLHTEIMREHLLVVRSGGGWRLSGLIDFEPAMPGEPEYEFASIGLFVSCGDGRLLRRILRAYGYPETELDAALQHRLMAQALLHRYSNLRWYLERLPLTGASTLEDLAQGWWSLGDGG